MWCGATRAAAVGDQPSAQDRRSIICGSRGCRERVHEKVQRKVKSHPKSIVPHLILLRFFHARQAPGQHMLICEASRNVGYVSVTYKVTSAWCLVVPGDARFARFAPACPRMPPHAPACPRMPPHARACPGMPGDSVLRCPMPCGA